MPIRFDNTYARLPERFYSRLPPTPVAAPGLVRVNDALAAELGLDREQLASPRGIAMLAGNHVPDGADPLAMVYAGFQFGGWVPQLGDGRAILLGELIDGRGVRRDVHLKGAGQTPYSRAGDGRAALGPVLREYIVSEAMHRLGVPTTRALAAVTTGELVYRETPLPGAILARVAASHLRVGTFQYFAARRDEEALRTLADYAIERHDPAVAKIERPYVGLLRGVIERQAALVAHWQSIGFIHGVMNTDNTTISGETIDYGPCAFMDDYHPETVYSSIDQFGRYAYRNQPGIARWNLSTFAQALLPLLGTTEAEAIAVAEAELDRFVPVYEEAYLERMRGKLGLRERRDTDDTLIADLLSCMADSRADFTLVFRGLADVVDGEAEETRHPRRLFASTEKFDAWWNQWRARLEEDEVSSSERGDRMRRANPRYIPRNHLVEEVIRAAEDRQDFGPFEKLVAVLASPFEEQPGGERYSLPPRPEQVVHQTFCGT